MALRRAIKVSDLPPGAMATVKLGRQALLAEVAALGVPNDRLRAERFTGY